MRSKTKLNSAYKYVSFVLNPDNDTERVCLMLGFLMFKSGIFDCTINHALELDEHSIGYFFSETNIERYFEQGREFISFVDDFDEVIKAVKLLIERNFNYYEDKIYRLVLDYARKMMNTSGAPKPSDTHLPDKIRKYILECYKRTFSTTINESNTLISKCYGYPIFQDN